MPASTKQPLTFVWGESGANPDDWPVERVVVAYEYDGGRVAWDRGTETYSEWLHRAERWAEEQGVWGA